VVSIVHRYCPNTLLTSHRHGSRATNYGGILGQGLRIAPPEAPVNGYMLVLTHHLPSVFCSHALN